MKIFLVSIVSVLLVWWLFGFDSNATEYAYVFVLIKVFLIVYVFKCLKNVVEVLSPAFSDINFREKWMKKIFLYRKGKAEKSLEKMSIKKEDLLALQETISKQKAEIEEINTRIHQLKEEACNLKKERETLAQQLCNEEDKERGVRQEINIMKKKHQQAEEITNQLKKELEQFPDILSQHKEQFDELKAKIVPLREEVEMALQQRTELEPMVKNLKMKIKCLVH